MYLPTYLFAYLGIYMHAYLIHMTIYYCNYAQKKFTEVLKTCKTFLSQVFSFFFWGGGSTPSLPTSLNAVSNICTNWSSFDDQHRYEKDKPQSVTDEQK